MTVRVCIGTKNQTKIEALHSAFEQVEPDKSVDIISCLGDHRITKWVSSSAVCLPFGVRQTCFGVVNRMKSCWDKCDIDDYSASFENGLVHSSEIGMSGEGWYDVGYASLGHSREFVVIPGNPILSTYDENKSGSTEEKIISYRQRLWKKGLAEGEPNRKGVLAEAMVKGYHQLQRKKEAISIIQHHLEESDTYSLKPHHRHMIWVSDLAYMLPAFLRTGKEKQVSTALDIFCKKQRSWNQDENNGYEKFDVYGMVSPASVSNEDAFLKHWLLGTKEHPEIGWATRLKMVSPPKMLKSFPITEGKTMRHCYQELKQYSRRLGTPPKPYRLLERYMTSRLWNITPHRRESEIHFIRALMLYHKPTSKLMWQLDTAIDRALRFVYVNVLDDDGLPKGCDAREIFTESLYDARMLTNAVFWYETLTRLEKYKKEVDVGGKKVELSKEKAQLAVTIKEKLLFRDFIPGEFAKSDITSSRLSLFEKTIEEQNPNFLKGEHVDVQGLALAVLNGLVEEKQYSKVVKTFKDLDTDVGVSIWPYISWTAVRALIAIGTPEAIRFAEEQKEKLLKLGFYEWCIAKEGKVIKRGDPNHGLCASEMLLALDAFNNYYYPSEEEPSLEDVYASLG